MERPTLHTRHKSGFSLKSDKSRASKQSQKETPEEKRKSIFKSSANSNPNAAMNEAQPVAQQLEESTLGSLRSMQHLDTAGQPIHDPDLSNPTRRRWESPLETIRSFEAAIDNGYKRRASMMMRPDSEADGLASGYASRRSSYYGGQKYPDHVGPRRQSQLGGFYSDRQSYYDGNTMNAGPQQAYGQRNRNSQRDPSYNRQASGQVYPTQQYHQSRDTVNTGDSSNPSDQWAHSTDPSSENSSIERKQTPGEWNYSGTGGPVQPNGRMPEERHNYRGANQPHPQNTGYFVPQQQSDIPPPPPKHSQFRAPNKVIRLSSADQFAQGQQAPHPHPKGGAPAPAPKAEKRKSWFKRTFSKE